MTVAIPSNSFRFRVFWGCVVGILEVKFHHIIAIAEESVSSMEPLHFELLVGEKSVDCLHVDIRAEPLIPHPFSTRKSVKMNSCGQVLTVPLKRQP